MGIILKKNEYSSYSSYFIDNRKYKMNIKVFIFSIFAILSNFQTIVTQSINNNNLVTNEMKTLLSNTQRSVRAYLSSILVDAIIQNVDVIFATASLNVSTIINKNYNCVTNNLTRISLRLLNLKYIFHFILKSNKFI
jgi:hypothetical protein